MTEATEAINRYDRQELISGWDQSKITNVSIAIVGSGHISNFLAASLTALGIGDIRIYDDARIDYEITKKSYGEREFLLSRARERASKVEALEKIVQKINPLIDVFGIHMGLGGTTWCLVEKPDIMVIAANDNNISSYKRFATYPRVPLYLVQGDLNGAYFVKYRPNLETPDYSGKNQDGITSEVISGLLVGEIVQDIMYGDGVDSLQYSPTGFNSGNSNTNTAALTNKQALVVGAGALGNFLGIGLSHAGLGRLCLVDDDIIDTTNLNRQILFYDAVGEPKADILAHRLNQINPEMEVIPIKQRVSESFETLLKQIAPDVLIDCVDNLATRALLNHFAIKYKIPLVSGGTDYSAGQVIVYVPGKSTCLDCRLGVDAALVRERTSRSCVYAPNPQVVVTNHVVGGLMASETRAVLDSENYGEPVKKMIKYDSTKNARIGLVGTEQPCSCKRRYTAKTWIKRLTSES